MSRFVRILSVFSFVFVLAGFVSAQNLPNVLLIMVDDLGYGDLSSYGATDLKSPHVDGLIASGMRFDNFYANCPVCSPTRASLLSGRYPELVGVPGVIRTHRENNWGYLRQDVKLLPNLLKKAGYQTAIIGKWHLGLAAPNRPNDRGFDYFHGYLGDMMDDYYNHRRHGINYMRHNTIEIDPEGHATDLFTNWSVEFLQEQRDATKPFFLFLSYNAPHTPIQPPMHWEQRVLDREAGISKKRAKLVALIEHLDDGIGRVLAALKDTGLDQNTLVLFTSDNGGQLNVGANNGATRDGKQSMYEGGLKVPTGIAWPMKIEPNSTSKQLLLTMDILPTLCEIAGVSVDDVPLDGQSFLPTLLGKPVRNRAEPVFFHRREGGSRYGGLTINAVRSGDWKLLQNSPFAPLELYDVKRDPLETVELSKKRPQVFRELTAKLRVQLQRGGAVPWQPPALRDATVD